MKKTKKILIGVFLLAVFATTSILLGSPRKAGAVPVSPDKYKLEVGAGGTVSQNSTKLVLMPRPEDTPAKWYVSIVGMRKEGEFHERNFYIPNSGDMNEPANWITLGTKEVDVKPGEKIVIPWTLTAPQNVTCGTKLAAIMVSDTPNLSTQSKNNETIVSLGREIISQVHVTITNTASGPCVNEADLSLVDFAIERDDYNKTDDDEDVKKIKKFLGKPVFNYDDIPFITRLENKGNILAENPQGFIEIRGMGDDVNIEFNDDELDVYQNTKRRFDDKWYEEDYPHNGSFWKKFSYELSNFRFGKYEATLSLTKNVDKDIESKVQFWIFPWRVILFFVILGIIILVVVIYALRQMRGKSKVSSTPPATN